MPTLTHADLFGVPLEELMGFDGEKGGVPRVVKDCIQYLRETGMHFVVYSSRVAYPVGQACKTRDCSEGHLVRPFSNKCSRRMTEVRVHFYSTHGLCSNNQ